MGSPNLSGLILPGYTPDASLSGLTPAAPSVTSLATDAEGKRTLLTLSTGTLLELVVELGTATCVSDGPSARMTALTAHPTDAHVLVTADMDGVLKVWNTSVSNRGVQLNYKLPRHATCVTFQGVDGTIVIALSATDTIPASILFMNLGKEGDDKDSPWCLSVLETYEDICESGDIHCMSVSPNGCFLAVGLDHGSIRIFTLPDNTIYCKFLAHEPEIGPVKGIDFTTDSKHIRTFSASPSSFDPKCKVEVHIFNIQVVPVNNGEVVSITPEECKVQTLLKGLISAKWASVSSPAAPEAKGVMSIAPASLSPDMYQKSNANELTNFDRKVSSVRSHTYYKPFTISLVTVEETVAALTTPLSDRKVQDHLRVSKSLASALREQEGDPAHVVERKLVHLLRSYGVLDAVPLGSQIMGILVPMGTARALSGGGSTILAAGYSDGTVEFRFPTAEVPACKLSAHSYGSVLTAFTAGGQFCSVGEEDGAILLYDVSM
jgi:WD40 repeat protein